MFTFYFVLACFICFVDPFAIGLFTIRICVSHCAKKLIPTNKLTEDMKICAIPLSCGYS